MLHKKQFKKIVAIVFMLVVVIMFTNSAYAAINDEYYEINKGTLNVAETALDSKISGSSLLNAVGHLIYSVGSLLEWILGKMYELIAGEAIFPWADAIVFNAIPLLDVNFINPTTTGGGALLGIIKNTLSDLYATIFGLALSFFSIAVMIMAIKMIVSTIASEKAKYKQAATQWAIGFLLLFVMHYGMSFIFYLNEQLVEVASNLASESISKAGDEIAAVANTTAQNRELVKNFIDVMRKDTANIGDWITGIGAVVAVISGVVIAVGTAGIGPLIAAAVGVGGVLVGSGMNSTSSGQLSAAQIQSTNQLFSAWVKAREEQSEELDFNKAREQLLYGKGTVTINGKKHEYEVVNIASELLRSETYRNIAFGKNLRTDNGNFWDTGAADKKYVTMLYFDVMSLVGYVEINDVEIKGIDLFRATYNANASVPADKRKDLADVAMNYFVACGRIRFDSCSC